MGQPVVDHERVRQRRRRQQRDPPGDRVGDLDRRGRDRTGRSRRPRSPAGRRVLGRRPVRSAPRCSTPPACPSPSAQVSISGPIVAVAGDDLRRVRVLRVPHARRVHRVGDRGHRCRRPGSARAEPVDVGDGRPDRVAARSTTTPRRRSPITGWSGSAATPATNIPIGIANTEPAAVRRSTRTPRARRRSRRCSRTRAATPCSPATAPTTTRIGLDTTSNRFYNNPGTTATVTVTPGGTTDDDGAALRPAGDGRRLAGRRRSSARRVTATETTAIPVAVHRGVHERRRRRARRRRSDSSRPTPAARARPRCRSVTGRSTRASGPKQGTVKVWRRITGVFNVTATGASTGTAHPHRHGDGQLSAVAVRRARRARRSQSGYTLIETMIAMMLLSVVLAAAFGVVSRDAARRDARPRIASPPRAKRRPSPTASPRTSAPRSRRRRPAPRSRRPT